MDFKYTITNFDIDKRVVSVAFADGGHADIPLIVPFPSTPEQLDAIVRNYAKPVQQIDAERADPTALTFIQDLIDTERVTSRIGSVVIEAPPPIKTADEIRAEKWEKIKEIRQNRISGLGYAGVCVEGTWFYADGPFRTVITQGLRLFALEELPADDPKRVAVQPLLDKLKTTKWKTMSGEFVQPEYLLAIKIDAAQAILTQACHERGEVLRAQVDGAADPSTVDITVGWPKTFGE